MLQRPSRSELKRLRQRRWRERQRRDVLCVQDEVPRFLIEGLVDLRWLEPAAGAGFARLATGHDRSGQRAQPCARGLSGRAPLWLRSVC